MRRIDPTNRVQRRDAIDGAVLGDDAFILRWFDAERGDRLLLVNLGHERRVSPVPEPLLAPPRGHTWRRVWSSDDPAYDGPGITEPRGHEPLGFQPLQRGVHVCAPDRSPRARLDVVGDRDGIGFVGAQADSREQHEEFEFGERLEGLGHLSHYVTIREGSRQGSALCTRRGPGDVMSPALGV